MRCPNCQSEIPDNSVFCLTCGRPIKEEGLEPIEPKSGSPTDMRATMLMAFSFMLLFFGLFLLFPAYFIGSSIVYILCTVMVAIGIVMIIARFLLLRSYTVKIEQFRAEAAEKVKCQYCGSMNSPGTDKCIGCHAPL